MEAPPAKRPDQYLGERVKTARNSRGWKQTDLVQRLQELGFTQWRQSKIAKIEKGETKRVTIDEALALAAALGVQLGHLLAPPGEDYVVGAVVEIAPNARVTPGQFRRWLRGQAPLSPDDAQNYYTGAIVPKEDWHELVALKRGGWATTVDDRRFEHVGSDVPLGATPIEEGGES